MIGNSNDKVLEEIYKRLKHIIDDVYRGKGLSSEEIKKYFLKKRNFNSLLDKLKDLEHTFDSTKYPTSFKDKVSDILFHRILMDRIYFERDNPQNESIVKNYNSFVYENKNII